MVTRLLILVALATLGVYAGPAGRGSQCSLKCTRQNTLAYQTGISYIYDYSVSTSTGLLGTIEKTADVHISAKAHIDVVSPCEYSLKLSTVSVKGSKKTDEFSEAVSAYPLRFSFQDGQIETICSNVQEPEWVLNFKRAVLSTFQTSVTQDTTSVNDVTETDISGICNTHFNAYTNENVLYITKKKDMASCSQRPTVPSFTSIEDIDEYTETPLQNLPIISSSQNCELELEEGILKKGGCSETHKFNPFSNGKGGAVTSTKTTLILNSQEPISSPAIGNKFIQSSLVFTKKEHINARVQIDITENIMKRIEMATQNSITSEVPTLFSSLVKSLRGLEYDQLSSVYKNAKRSNSLKYLIDAMPLVKTAAAMEIVKDMMKNFDINDNEEDIFFTSLALINQPSSKMFTVLAPLLENNPKTKAMLGVSALVNNYCKINNKCIEESGIQKVVRNIEFQLGSACRTTKEDDKTSVLVALKALGNAGYMVNSKSVLRRCYTEENDIEIRVAAIEAWRHTPCDYDRSHLLVEFQDETQGTEIRIAAYLATMTCPTAEIIDVINSHLISEGVNHVTSFVWTHITNIQESAAPGKKIIQELKNEEFLQNKFKSDALKYSRNFETSLYRGDLNVGAALESNVVFSSTSLLPRSAMLNLTVDLFGESINFFEVGGRINGFESIFEHFFGPEGYYPEETVQTIISSLRKQQNNGEDTFEGVSEKLSDEPKGSYYLRIFGNEVSYKKFHGFNDLLKGDLFTNPFDLLMELVSNGDIDYTKSYQIFDNEIIFPTATGLPLKLKLDGTATLALKGSGNFNVRSISNVNIEGKIYPSAAVMIDSSMIVDSPLIHSGMKMLSTMHTSTYVEGKLKIDGSKIVDVAINTPEDKMEIFNVNTEFFHIEDDDLIKEDPVNTIQDNTCTQDTLGIAFCKEITYITQNPESPNVYLSNLVTAKVYIKKIDTHTGYLLQYIHKPEQIYFVFDTPDSKINRNIAFSFQFKENQLSYDIVSPIKSIKGKGEIEWQAMNKKVIFSNIIDSKQYMMQGGIRITENKELKTEFKITSQDEEIIDITATGHLSIDKYLTSELQVDYSFMNNMKNSFNHSFFFKKEASTNMSKYILHFELKSSQYSNLNLGLDWKTDLTSEYFDNQIMLQFGPAVWNVKLLYDADKKNYENKRNIQFEVSCPYYNFNNKGTLGYFLQPDNFQLETKLDSREHKYHQFVSLSYNSGVKLSGVAKLDIFIKDSMNFSNSAALEMKKLEKGHYTLQMKHDMKTASIDRKTEIEGSIINKSSSGAIMIDILGSFKNDQNEIKCRSTISAKNDVGNVDFNLEHNGNIYYTTIQGTHTSLIFDSNILQHIVLRADIIPSGETCKFSLSAEWNKDVDPTAIMLVNGEFSKNLIKAGLKYSMNEFSTLVKKTDTGLEVETSWSPDKKVAAKVIYSLDNVKSFTIIVNTPFKGYESQMLDIMFSLSNYEVKASFSATWRKSKLLLFTLDTKVRHSLHSNMIKSNINFSSTFEHFSLLNLSLNHQLESNSILTEINGKWNDQEINGKIKFKALEIGAEFMGVFVSPFTKDLMVDMKCSLDRKNLSLILKGQYGLLNSKFSIKGYKINNNSLSIILSVDTPYQSIPKLFSNISYRFDGIKKEFVADSKIGDKKYMILINVSKEIKDSSLNIEGDIRLITPLSYPITITFHHKQDDKIFTSNFDTTRFWSTNGSLKGSIEGKIMSENDMHFSIRMESPDFYMVSEINHRFQNEIFDSNLDLTINEERIALEAKGTINENNGIVKLHMGMVSTNQVLDDVKLDIDHAKNGIKQLSKISLQKGIRKVKLLHQLSFNDFYNFDNTIELNDLYKFNNKQTFDGRTFTHKVKYDWVRETIQATLRLGHQIEEKNNNLDLYLFLKTPWTFDKILQIHYEDDGIMYMSNIIFEYEHMKQIELSNVCICAHSFCSLKSSLTTPFWKSLDIEFSYKFKTEKDVTISLGHGNNSTKIHVNATIESGYLDGQVNLDSSYFKMPLKVLAHYNFNGIEKFAQFGIITDKWYGIKGQYYAADLKNMKSTVTAELPFEGAEKLEMNTEYHATNLPYQVSIKLKINNDIYKIDGILSGNEFKVGFTMKENTALIHLLWKIEAFSGKLEIKLISPISSIDNINTSVMYNFNEKNISVKLKIGSKEISITGKINGQHIIIEGITPFIGWEVLKASIFVTDTAFDITTSKNEMKVVANGKYHIKPSEGHIIVNITTPYSSYETISIDTKYSLQNIVKSIELKSIIGGNILTMNGVSNFRNELSPELIIDIETPFNNLKKIGSQVYWDLSTSTKLAKINVYQNEKEYLLQFEASFNAEKGLLRVDTPIPGFENIEAEYVLNTSNYKSDILVTIKTPFYKNIEINTKYNLLKFDELINLEIISDQTKYGFSFGGNIIKDGGFIHLALKTPMKEWYDIKFKVQIDFSTVNKTFEIMLEKDGNVRAISISGEVFGDMDLKIQFPDIGMQNLDLSLGTTARTKRSIESKMMNDGLNQFDKFNSMKVNIKSDYAALSDLYMEWLNDNENTNKISVKNKDNYFNIMMTEGNRKAWDVSVESKFQAWPARYLLGYIGNSELRKYLQEQEKDDPSNIKAKGNFGPKKGTFNMEINSPYKDYKKVEIKLDYNLASKSLSFDAKSSSSNFKIDVQLKGRIKIDFLIPGSVQDIVLNMDVNPFKGNISWESPFLIKSFEFKHEVRIGKTVTVNVNTKLNGQEQFKLIFERNKSQKRARLEMESKGTTNYVIRFNRVAWEEITLSMKMNENEIKMTANGSGDLPQQGKFDVVVNISILNFERTVTMQAHVDRSSEEKSLKLEIESEADKLYTIDLKGIINPKNMQIGQYKLDIKAPEKIKSIFSSTAAKWDLTKGAASDVEVTLGSVTYTIKGEFGRDESNLVISSNKPGTSDMFLEWRSKSIIPNFDSYFKAGPKKNYLMWKLKGNIPTRYRGSMEGGFRIPMLMKHDFTYDSTWESDSSGVITGGGRFQYGDKSGEHTCKSWKHDDAKKTASIHWEATSNIPNWKKMVWKGEYDFNKKFYINHKLEWDTNNISINFDVGESSPAFSNNTGILHTPMWGDVELTFNHDFRNNMEKSVTWKAKMKGKEYSIISEWGRSDKFDIMKGEIKLVGPIIGEVQCIWDSDTSNISDSNLEIYYKRNNSKNISIEWSRKKTNDVLRTDFAFKSHFKRLKSFKFFLESNFSEGIDIELVIDWSKKITFNLLLDHSKLNLKFTTPFPGFEKAEGLINFDIGDKTKTIKAHYERGNRAIDFNMKLEIPNNNEGSLSITASSPFEFARNVDLNATWKNGNGEVSYTRNGVTLTFNGDAIVTSDEVSFDLAFIQSNNQNPIKLAATYNLANLNIKNTDTLKTIAKINFEIDGYISTNEMQGYRNSDRVYIIMDAKSNIPGLKQFKFVINTSLNEMRSHVQFLFNEFNIEFDTLYENRPNGFYWRYQTYSSYMLISGLVTGFGVENGEWILTTGYRDSTEVVLYIKPKGSWAEGFSGRVELPKQNDLNVGFDVTYKYNSDDELLTLIELDENGNKTNFEIIYNSDGLKASLYSPFLGKRSIRIQRSITNDGFFAETAIDGYGIKLKKGFSNENSKRGIKIEGEILGEKILIDTLFQSDGYKYVEGKIIFEMPFLPKVGGSFTWKNKDKKMLGQMEIYLPSPFTPKISSEINLDLNKAFNCFIKVDIVDQEYTIKCNIVSSNQKEYKASIMLLTPYHAFRKLDIKSQLKMGSQNNIMVKLYIETPTTNNELALSYEIKQSVLKVNAFIDSSMMHNNYRINLILSEYSVKQTKFELLINENKFDLDYSIDNGIIKGRVETIIHGNERTLSVESDYSSIDTMKIDINVIMNEKLHKFKTLLNVNNKHIHGYLEINSEFINGSRKINFDISIPKAPFNTFSMDISLGALETYSFHVDYDTNNGLELNIRLENVDISQLEVHVLCNYSTVFISLELPNGVHKVNANWHTLHGLHSDFTWQIELSSTLLSQDYLIKSILNNDISDKSIDLQLILGSNKHSMAGNIILMKNSSEASFKIDSIYLSFKEALVKYMLIPENSIEMTISSTFGNKFNQFSMKIDKQNGNFIALADSPFISTGLARAEASLMGDIENGMVLNMAMKNSVDVISCNLDLQMPSHIFLKINTPFTGYKNMIFGAKYNTGNTNVISLFVDKPLKVNLDIELKSIDILYQTHIKLRTPIENLEMIEAQIFIPIDKFAPRIMWTIHGQKYGAEIKVEEEEYNYKLYGTLMTGAHLYNIESVIKTRAPFVFGYKFEKKSSDAIISEDTFSKNFHIRMDSSFLEMFKIQKPLISIIRNQLISQSNYLALPTLFN